jgi:predicted transcriptional regulator
MAEHSRVARWRQRLRDEGRKAVTVWLSAAEELRLKDLAATWHTSPSAIMQHALAQFQPGRPPSLSYDTETAQYQTSDSLDTSQIQAWLHAELPGMVRQIMEQLAEEIFGRASSIAEEQIRSSVVTENRQTSSSDVTEIAGPRQPTKRGGRPRSAMGQRILELLAQYPGGLTAEQLRGYLSPERPIGDLLSGMRRTGAVAASGEGRQLRYRLPSP